MSRPNRRAWTLLVAPLLAVSTAFGGAAAAQEPTPPRSTEAEAKAAASEAGGVVPQEEAAEPATVGFLEALRSGTATVALRYRHESVVDDAFANNGHASTLRTALGYTTGAFHGFRVFLQAENVLDVGAGSLHNDAGRGDRGNGVTGRPVIADPSGTDVLQAGMEWSGHDTVVKVGRQEIILDDARFVGNVGWRQHHQSFGAVRASNASLGAFTGQYAYVDRVYRIFGDSRDTATHLIHARYDLGKVGAITAYGYLLRYQDQAFYGLSTDTFGAEFKGASAIGDAVALRYELEYAAQSDAGDNPGYIRADYVSATARVQAGGFGVACGYEMLAGSAQDGQFNTPMATLHAFNGWADKFVSTPVNGLQDLHVYADGPLGPLRWMLRYMVFHAATGDARYGDEVDFQIEYTAPWKQSFMFRGGVYNADTFSADTTKLWLQSGYSF